MKECYKTIYQGGEGTTIEKKSRFIATIAPIETEDAALTCIETLKKRYWDASHNCYAFVLGEDMQMQRFSDDGEPQGTAGKPILDVLLSEEIHNVLIVVTRYFGGTLLGTGGLVRAYGKAARAGIEKSIIIEKKLGIIIVIHTDYNAIGKIQYLLGQKNIDILHSEYTQEVVIKAIVPIAQLQEVWQAITEVSSGKGIIKEEKKAYFSKDEKALLLFDLPSSKEVR